MTDFSELKQTHILLLKALLLSDNAVISTGYLATSTGLSNKSIRKYLITVNDVLQSQAGAKISTIRGFGISVKVLDEKKYQYFYQYFTSKFQGSKLMQLRYSNDVIFIAIKLLFALDKYYTYQYFSEKLYKDRKSIIKDFVLVKNLLEEFHLAVSVKPRHGFYIVGNESNIRVAMADHFNINVNAIHSEFINRYYSKEKTITDIIIEGLLSFNISMSEKSINKLARIIYISMRRDVHGYYLENRFSTVDRTEISNEYFCAKFILQKLDFYQNEDEIRFLAIYISSRRVLSEYNCKNLNLEYYNQLSALIIKYITKRVHANIANSLDLQAELSRHLLPMYYRLKYGLEKKSVKIIESKYNNEFYEYAVIASEYIERTWKTAVAESEISYLSYVFYSMLLSGEHKKSRILISSFEGINTSKIIDKQLTEFFKEFILSSEIVDNYALDRIDYRKYDLFISDIANINIPIPTVFINSYLSGNDYSHLKRAFEIRSHYIHNPNSYLSKKLIFLKMNINSPKDLLSFVNKQISISYHTKDEISQVISSREKLARTDVENSILILHSYTSFFPKSQLMIIRLKKPMFAYKKCKLILFVINGKNEPFPFSFLSYIRSIVSNSQFANSLLSANTSEKLISVFMNNHLQ